MTLFNQSLGALVLAALALPANAVNVTVHNQAHYLVSFEVNGRHSGNFGIDQSRTLENASGVIRINWSPGIIWCSTTDVYGELQVGKYGAEITFQGDIFNPVLLLSGLGRSNGKYVRPTSLLDARGICLWEWRIY